MLPPIVGLLRHDGEKEKKKKKKERMKPVSWTDDERTRRQRRGG